MALSRVTLGKLIPLPRPRSCDWLPMSRGGNDKLEQWKRVKGRGGNENHTSQSTMVYHGKNTMEYWGSGLYLPWYYHGILPPPQPYSPPYLLGYGNTRHDHDDTDTDTAVVSISMHRPSPATASDRRKYSEEELNAWRNNKSRSARTTAISRAA